VRFLDRWQVFWPLALSASVLVLVALAAKSKSANLVIAGIPANLVIAVVFVAKTVAANVMANAATNANASDAIVEPKVAIASNATAVLTKNAVKPAHALNAAN